MKNATHSNMENIIEEDMVENFRKNLKFQRRNNHKFNEDQANSGNNINNDINESNISNNQNNENNNSQEIPLNDNPDRKIIIKDFFLNSRLTKFFPHLFINYALDFTHYRKRQITEKEATNKMLYNHQGI